MPTAIYKPRAKRILIADDYHDTVETWSQLLQIFHYEIDKAYDGRSALDLALAQLPAAVILDIGLPMIDGFAVARKLREYPELSNSVLIGHSGRCNEDSFRRAQESGFDYFFEKPADPGVLLSCLEPDRYAGILHGNVIGLTSRELQERSQGLRAKAAALSVRSQDVLSQARELLQSQRKRADRDWAMPGFLNPNCAVSS